ncbi:MAG: ABC transporter permease [Propionicimonas sp.]|nr:ABC transporter permease [Propionicimonas sp.]
MRWLVRTLASVVPVVVGVVLGVFFLLRIVPGDPAQMILGDQATTASIEELRSRLGLDLPLSQQFAAFLAGIVSNGDLGRSLVTDQPVSALIGERVGITLALVALALVFTVLLAVPLALAAAVNRDGPVDHVVRALPAVGMAMPAFWIGLLLVLVFGLGLRWFPVGGIGSGPGEPLRSLVLPALTVALGMSPPLVRSLREQLVEVLDADFVATARAAGLPARRVLGVHVLRNAAVPTLALLGVNVAYLIGGTLVVEKVFAINGMGALLFSAVSTRDFPVVQGIALFCALAVVVVSLATDLLVGVLDPRLRR